MPQSLTAVDLFSGCGGMTLGVQSAGVEVLAGFENWEPALNVYKANFDHPVIDQDLSNVEEAVAKILEFNPQLVVGGPPCQDFSTAGRRDESRGRAALSIRFSEIICSVNPSFFIMENVAAIRGTECFEEVLSNFRESGYGVTDTVLDASYCGVPQSRKRMFVVGALGEPEQFLLEELGSHLSDSPMSIRDYFGDSLDIDHYFRVPTNYRRRGVFSVDEPSMTIRSVDRPVPPGYPGHPNDSAPVSTVRGLTLRERSGIQTFPESFEFFGSKSDINTMIANAVPVNLAEYVVNALLRYIKSSQKS